MDAALAILRDHPDMRIIFQTAHNDPANWSRMTSVFAEAILTKPVDEARLIRAVNGVMGVAA